MRDREAGLKIEMSVGQQKLKRCPTLVLLIHVFPAPYIHPFLPSFLPSDDTSSVPTTSIWSHKPQPPFSLTWFYSVGRKQKVKGTIRLTLYFVMPLLISLWGWVVVGVMGFCNPMVQSTANDFRFLMKLVQSEILQFLQAKRHLTYF